MIVADGGWSSRFESKPLELVLALWSGLWVSVTAQGILPLAAVFGRGQACHTPEDGRHVFPMFISRTLRNRCNGKLRFRQQAFDAVEPYPLDFFVRCAADQFLESMLERAAGQGEWFEDIADTDVGVGVPANVL